MGVPPGTGDMGGPTSPREPRRTLSRSAHPEACHPASVFPTRHAPVLDALMPPTYRWAFTAPRNLWATPTHRHNLIRHHTSLARTAAPGPIYGQPALTVQLLRWEPNWTTGPDGEPRGMFVSRKPPRPPGKMRPSERPALVIVRMSWETDPEEWFRENATWLQLRQARPAHR